jgi:hypothetical protein
MSLNQLRVCMLILTIESVVTIQADQTMAT